MPVVSPPIEIVAAFNNRIPPFDRDIVTTELVRLWCGSTLGVYPSDRLIYEWLTTPLFNGIRRKVCSGPHGHQTWQRVMILRGSWQYASGSSILTHLEGALDVMKARHQAAQSEARDLKSTSQAGKWLLAAQARDALLAARDPLCE